MKTLKPHSILFGFLLLVLFSQSIGGFSTLGSTNMSEKVTLDETNLDISEDNIGINMPPVIKAEPTIPINVVFLGTNQSYIDEQHIDNNITKFNAPLIAQKSYLYYSANYSMDLNYYYSSQQMETDFVNYINSIAYASDPPQDLLSYYDGSVQSAFYINASKTLSWLDNNVNSYFSEDINSTYTFYIIDTYTDGYINDYYFYETSVKDADTGMQSPNTLTNYFGGIYPSRGVFLDLSAGPVYYQEFQQLVYSDDHPNDEGVDHTSIIPMWQYDLDAPGFIKAFADQLNEYIMETIELVFLPSYLYIPEIRTNQDIRIVLFDDGSSSVADMVNIDSVLDAFHWLLPYYDISVTYSIVTLSDYPDVQQVMEDNTELVNQNGKTYEVIATEPVINYMMNNKIDFNMTDNSWPVYIWAWDADRWLSGVGVLGVGFDDGNGNPEMVAMGYPVGAGNSYEGYTATIIHEVGHLIGLRHPHDGISWDRYNDTNKQYISIYDWLPDFISTPMTYANPDQTFSTFDADQMDRGYALNRINSSWWDMYKANVTLHNKNYDEVSQLPEKMIKYLEFATANMTLSLNSFDDLNFFDAFYYANDSYFNSLAFLEMASGLDDYQKTVEPPANTIGTIIQDRPQDTNPFDLPFFFSPMILFMPILIRKWKQFTS